MLDRRRVPAELLAQRHRHRVHQVGPPHLHDRGELLGLRLEHRHQVLQRRDQLQHEQPGGGQLDRGREHVVGGLRRVHVVVRVHGPAEALRRQPSDDLVGVHVARGPRAGLEHVDRERVVVLAAGHVGGRVVDRVRQVGVEHAQLAVDPGGAALDAPERADHVPPDALAGHREVLHRPLRLRAPQRVGRDEHLAHRVVLSSVLRLRAALKPLPSFLASLVSPGRGAALWRARSRARPIDSTGPDGSAKKSFPLSSTTMNAGKSRTSICQTASMPSSGYSSTSTRVMQSWASRAAAPPIEPR